jgi:NAD(P)-dependent dehydrogenase (short-subunit alcohol dehydrogenase family)
LSQNSRLQGVAVQAAVAKAEDVERLFKESMDAFGRPDVVVKAKGVREHGNFKSKRRTEWETRFL